MAFKFTKKNATKAAFRAQVSRKQKMFKRFKKRYAACTSMTEKRFLKSEAGKVVRQLRTFAKQYRRFGFGNTSWITKNYNMTNFTTTTRKTTRKSTKRSYARRTSRSYGRRTRSWSRRRNTRSNRTNRSYVAW